MRFLCYICIPSRFSFIASFMRVILSCIVLPLSRAKLLPHPQRVWIASFFTIHLFPTCVIVLPERNIDSSDLIWIRISTYSTTISVSESLPGVTDTFVPAHHFFKRTHEISSIPSDFHFAYVRGSNFIEWLLRRFEIRPAIFLTFFDGPSFLDRESGDST